MKLKTLKRKCWNRWSLSKSGTMIPEIGLIFALGQFGTAPGLISSPFLAKRSGLIKGVVFCLFSSLPFMEIMAFSHNFWVCALCFVFRCAFMNICIPMRQETMMSIIPEYLRERASAVYSMSWNLAWALATFFSGAILKNRVYDVSLLIAVVCYLTSAAIFYMFFTPWSAPES